MSILTFNLSVKDKSNLASIDQPFQIMPATNRYISDSMIANYVECQNPNIVLHMNYITKIYSDNAVMNDSTARYSIRQYTKLADVLGTKDILIHMPFTEDEYENLQYGMEVIKEEICDKGYVVHLEIPAWSKELIALMTSKSKDPKVYVCEYLDMVFAYCEEFKEDSYMFVPDTAHLWSNGCTEIEHFEHILNRYKGFIKYVHLNGNVNPPFKMDIHAPIFDATWNKMDCSQDIAELCVSMNVICIAEITKYGMDWTEWKKCAKAYGFKLVKPNTMYTI